MGSYYRMEYIEKFQIFTIENVSDIANGVLSADYDDGYVAYLNGMEISRSANLNHFGTQVPFDANTSFDHEAMLYDGGFPDNILIDSLALESILVDGPNVLAVQIHNVDIKIIEPNTTMGYILKRYAINIKAISISNACHALYLTKL